MAATACTARAGRGVCGAKGAAIGAQVVGLCCLQYHSHEREGGRREIRPVGRCISSTLSTGNFLFISALTLTMEQRGSSELCDSNRA